jgi:hypothetical protein
MLDIVLKSDNPLVRIGFATIVVFGGLYFATSVGLIPARAGWLVSVIILIMVCIRNIGGKRASFT